MRGPHCRPGSVGTPSCRRGCLKETFNRAITLLTYPGISVIHHSRVACQSAQGHCLHDATEGGLVTGFREVAWASGLGLAVEEGSIPVLAECQTVCQGPGPRPSGAAGLGGTAGHRTRRGRPGTSGGGWNGKVSRGWEIGQMMAPEEGLQMIGYQGEVPLPEFPRDELARSFASAS